MGIKIKNIKHIRNYGIFSAYQKGGTKDFGNNNIIFGWNYSGKTTFSRIFRSLEVHQKPEGFEKGQFKINLDNNLEITDTDINISYNFSSIEQAVKDFNHVIKKNEEKSANFSKEKNHALGKLKKHYASRFHVKQKYEEIQKKIIGFTEAAKNLEAQKTENIPYFIAIMQTRMTSTGYIQCRIF